MKKLTTILLLSFTALLLVACGNTEEPITEVPELHELEAVLTVVETADVGEAVKMETIVTQGEEVVDDASEVVYEVWEEGAKSSSEMIDSVNEGQGLYTAEKVFNHDGLFHIQVHVTANAQHTMPVVQVVIGEGGDYDDIAEDSNFSLHFNDPGSVAVGEEGKLTTHIELNGSAVEAATVRFEIMQDGMAIDEGIIEADELTPGEYGALYTFEEEGMHQVHIYVENDEGLQEEAVYEIDVIE